MQAETSEVRRLGDGLADRALELVEDTARVLGELAVHEPQTAVALAKRLYEKVAGKGNPNVNGDKEHVSSDAGRPPAGERPTVEHGNDEIRSFLKPSDIEPRSLRNRKLRGALFDDIVLMLLLANSDKNLVAADVKSEFLRLQIEVRDTALLSRIARLRESGALERVSVTGTGFYRLSDGGKKAAQSAKDSRIARS